MTGFRRVFVLRRICLDLSQRVGLRSLHRGSLLLLFLLILEGSVRAFHRYAGQARRVLGLLLTGGSDLRVGSL